MKKSLKVKGTVECLGFVGRERVVDFEFVGPISLKFKGGISRFSLDVPVGTESILAKTAWSLAQRKSVEDPHFVLPGGDLNGDNKVNTLDYTLVRFYINRRLPVSELPESAVADINGDGIVDEADLGLLAATLGRIGDS